MTIKSWQVITIASVTILVPILFYGYSFTHLSTESSDWANFGSYWSAFIALSNLIVFIILTVRLSKIDQARRDSDSEMQKNLERPVIVFTKIHGEKFYRMKNAGKGSALNIKIQSHILQDKWQHHKLAYSLINGDSLPMSFTYPANAILCTYEDILNTKYHSLMNNDTMHFLDEKKLENNPEYKRLLELDSVAATWFD
ncbi:hypothetical protein [Pinibacter aurantiacus]|uniref:Uncharacterized protein n=1 Tax=Pinibacter aurantiacus TaxID=2851599 RepID=A0A9E2S7S9_9BACT|nr:hypothetical protein [Pinibacter aurantiacus]MBV4356294.1 hypothetical protein [Pinibacter aurantiacus]